MFARIVSLFTLAAVVGCPMWCNNPQCHGTHCCASETEAAQPKTCEAHSVADCCCGKSSPADDQDCPCPYSPAPTKSSCQGVCGGAVLEKPSELPTDDDCLSLPLIDVQGAVVSSQVERSSTGDGVDAHCGGNYGRLLRTLRMSFLC